MSQQRNQPGPRTGGRSAGMGAYGMCREEIKKKKKFFLPRNKSDGPSVIWVNSKQGAPPERLLKNNL